MDMVAGAMNGQAIEEGMACGKSFKSKTTSSCAACAAFYEHPFFLGPGRNVVLPIQSP